MKTITIEKFMEWLRYISSISIDENTKNIYIEEFNKIRDVELTTKEDDKRYFKKLYLSFILDTYKRIGIGQRSDFFDYTNNISHIADCSRYMLSLYDYIGNFTDYNSISELNKIRVWLSYFIDLLEKVNGCKVADNLIIDQRSSLYNFLFAIGGSKSMVELIICKSSTLAMCPYSNIEYYNEET